MTKTTVYLPEPLKRSLGRLARRQRKSEAELIRLAIARVVGESVVPRPKLPLFRSREPDLAERVDAALSGFGE
jgi:hypothetical protein